MLGAQAWKFLMVFGSQSQQRSAPSRRGCFGARKEARSHMCPSCPKHWANVYLDPSLVSRFFVIYILSS